jgi:hypothetical protein
MLKNAYGNISVGKLNDLISEGNYKYLNFSSYNNFEQEDLHDNDWDKIQKISVNEDGYTIAYFSVTLSRLSQRISGTMFVKFRYLEHYNEEIADADFQEFIELIMNHPIFKRITIMAVKDNPANRTYERWLVKYSGKRFLLPKYTILTDGKLHDVWYYYFDREDNNSLKGDDVICIQ